MKPVDRMNVSEFRVAAEPNDVILLTFTAQSIADGSQKEMTMVVPLDAVPGMRNMMSAVWTDVTVHNELAKEVNSGEQDSPLS